MSRKLAGQVGTSVSRLLRGGFLKQEPVWFQAVIAHPPAPPKPRSPIVRPVEDLPPSLAARQKRLVRTFLGQASSQSGAASSSPSSSSSSSSSVPDSKRPPRMSAKRLRALTPELHPQPIFYLQDRVRRQFYRDHPWEAYRPRTLVEMDKVVVIDKSSPLGAPEDARELRAWGRNPGPEDVVSCTIHLHEKHGLSLSQAYHHSIASYHALRAEHETASRYAVLEAEAYGAQFGPTETTLAFRREHRQIFGTDRIDQADEAAPTTAESTHERSASRQPPTMISVTPDQLPVQKDALGGSDQTAHLYVEPRGKFDRARRIKNVDDTFTAGDKYLEAAFSTSQAALARLRS
ncbi:unnamed protein product [Tilletia controversa]|uniref:Small ribosomal subunit protein mS23 n=3 Tax=Tilletia TaxID=13289 RepID=A0A8X7MV68_9BASI|nr:hypothetical protein CF336_g1410 [Tilletia laevis]KAE8203796.1 hypothetical protein CF328_g1450 [Tilletia controversa]KAE8264240.1 hypothetical protein A4X03_0g1087 [Tilletia caries]KAE8205546.1 hypothetical protein CF335_g2264 [Tilletia laevis]KAE8248490.1 hypothetical protein A4X06_0g3675 [Tilletia controversa]